MGSGAVRTISGTMSLHLELERRIAAFKNVEACVVFQSGFTANSGVVSAILGPEDHGHWKDKLPYVEHDLKLLSEREWLLDRFGVFQAGFDFGAPGDDSRKPIYRGLPYLRGNTVEPRFQLATPETTYTDESGFGWATDGERDAVPQRLTPPANRLRER